MEKEGGSLHERQLTRMSPILFLEPRQLDSLADPVRQCASVLTIELTTRQAESVSPAWLDKSLSRLNKTCCRPRAQCMLALASLVRTRPPTITTTVSSPPVVIWCWLFRYIHIALDTVVLYGALIERNLSERGDHTSSGGSGGLSSRRPAADRGARRAGSRGSNISSNPVTSAPVA